MKKIHLKEKITKKTIKLTLLLLTLIIILCYLIFQASQHIGKHIQKTSFENQITSFAQKNEKTVFSIDNITLFSSSDAKNKVSSKTNFTLENIYAYTDIAIFINHNSTENTLENTLKSVSIENVEFTKLPEQGQANLYYKNLNDFAKPYIPETEPIDKNLSFDIISEETTDFSKPVLYNNCANPITLSFVNENIKTDYTILDIATPITYNGSLLKRCNIPITTIAASLSFDIYITNNKDEKFTSKVFIDIPYKDGEKSIYDGNITIKPDVNFVFYRYE